VGCPGAGEQRRSLPARPQGVPLDWNVESPSGLSVVPLGILFPQLTEAIAVFLQEVGLPSHVATFSKVLETNPLRC